MKKITFIFLFLIGGVLSSFAQFSENFDASTTLPTGWSVINGGDTNTWTVSTPGTGSANSGTNVVRIYYTSTTAHDDYLITPQFTVTAGISDYLSLWAKNRSATYPEPFDILLSSTGTANTDFTTTIAAAVSPATTWGEYHYDLSAYAGQTVYIAFRSTTLDEWQLYLDDITVAGVPNSIDYANLQWPPTATFAQGGGDVTVYGQVYEAGLTDVTSGQAPGIQAWVGYSTTNTNPSTWTNWTTATFNGESGNNDEYKATIGAALTQGTYYYATRFKLGAGGFVYGGIDASNNGNFWDGTTYNSGVLTITAPLPPANDDCSGAIDVTCGSTTTGTTTAATNENATVCGISGVTTQNTPGVWYKYTGDGSDVTVTTCSSTITTGDSRIAVYSGSCGSMTCVGGNDDAGAAGCSSNTLASTVSFSTVTGTDYYILVYAYSTSTLSFELNVSCVSACSPATTNDECATALPLTVGTTASTDNTCSSASLDTTYPTCGGLFNTYYDTWYSFDTGTDTDFTVTMANPTGTTGFAVYSGACGSLTMVTGSCSTTATSVNLTGLTTGTTYYVRTFSTTSAARGAFDLTVSTTLGTSSFDNGSFSYYPNPVKNMLSLSYNQEISNVEIFNLLGQKVSSNKINANQAQVDMSSLSSGAYMVKVTSNNQVKTIKVIKE